MRALVVLAALLSATTALGCASARQLDDAGRTPDPIDAGTDAPPPAIDATTPDAGLACLATELECDGACVDPRSDALHCGACDTACDAGEVCSGGTCGCPSGQTACADGCHDLLSDDVSCGGCGRMCLASEHCELGACVSDCEAGLTFCRDLCVDTETDEAHCGGCAEPCITGEECVAGTCVPPCGAGLSMCASGCVDLSSDRANCGRCAAVCGRGQSCVAGACVAAPATFVFPAAGDTRFSMFGTAFWNAGDFVQGSRTLTAPSLSSASFTLAIVSNGLSCDTQDVRALINGTEIGRFAIRPSETSSAQSFTFAPIAAVGGAYTIRIETTRTVASGCGAAGYSDGTTTWTVR